MLRAPAAQSAVESTKHSDGKQASGVVQEAAGDEPQGSAGDAAEEEAGEFPDGGDTHNPDARHTVASGRDSESSSDSDLRAAVRASREAYEMRHNIVSLISSESDSE